MAKIKTYENDNTINANDKLIGTDFNDSDKTKNYLISALKSYILSGLDVRPYKVYTALLTQSGTEAPVATVLENTLGGEVVWSYVGVGDYRGTLSNTFTENKTYPIGSFNENYDPFSQAMLACFLRLNSNQVLIQTAVSNGDSSNNLLSQTPIEIRVYN
jgi:hypothetical protein